MDTAEGPPWQELNFLSLGIWSAGSATTTCTVTALYTAFDGDKESSINRSVLAAATLNLTIYFQMIIAFRLYLVCLARIQYLSYCIFSTNIKKNRLLLYLFIWQDRTSNKNGNLFYINELRKVFVYCMYFWVIETTQNRELTLDV